MQNKKQTWVVVVDLKKPIEYQVKASSEREAKKIIKERLTCASLSKRLEFDIFKAFY